MVSVHLSHANLRIVKLTALDSISPSEALYLCRSVDYCAIRHFCTKPYVGIFAGVRDIGPSIPVIGLAIALALHSRRLSMTIADYIEDRRKKAQDKIRKEAEARGEARAHEEWDSWLARRESAEAIGEPFNESPPSRKSNTGK